MEPSFLLSLFPVVSSTIEINVCMITSSKLIGINWNLAYYLSTHALIAAHAFEFDD